MKYLKFDYEGLLNEYKDNKQLIKSLNKQINYFEKGIGNELDYMEIIANPDTVRELHEKKEEAELYVFMVDNAFSALKEIERDALDLFFVEQMRTQECAERMGVSVREFFRIKALAFDKFCHIVYWN